MKTIPCHLLLIIVLLSSCRTPSDITYFENLQNRPDSIIQITAKEYALKLEPSDELHITVIGKSPEAVAQYNVPGIILSGNNQTGITPTEGRKTYIIDNLGNIDFPMVGKMHLAGKTTLEVKEELQKIISKEVKDPIVNVTLLNFKISVMGEVNAPGMYELKNERATILDAINMAGDLTITGQRKNILLLREENGKKYTHHIDLTNTDLFNSPYYFLKQNDILYIAPNAARKNSSKIDPSKQYNLSLASTITSAISVIASLCIALILK